MSNLSSCVRTTTAVSRSSWICANASSGHSTTISSALGTRSGVANRARASTQIVRQPTDFASAHSASPVSTAPTTTSRGGGPKTSAKIVSPSCSSVPLRRISPRQLSQAEHVVADDLAPVEQDDQLAAQLALARDDREDDGALGPVREREQRVGDAQSRGSRKTSISPPHGSPTPSAWSSVIP